MCVKGKALPIVWLGLAVFNEGSFDVSQKVISPVTLLARWKSCSLHNLGYPRKRRGAGAFGLVYGFE